MRSYEATSTFAKAAAREVRGPVNVSALPIKRRDLANERQQLQAVGFQQVVSFLVPSIDALLHLNGFFFEWLHNVHVAHWAAAPSLSQQSLTHRDGRLESDLGRKSDDLRLALIKDLTLTWSS